MAPMRDTIYALSSGAPPAGVAVVRVSGGACDAVLEELCGGTHPPRHAMLRWIRGRNGEPIDQGLVIRFVAPHSFTGEDSLEFHVHGGRAVVEALLAELGSMPGLRHAEAGEFSRRAFDNGKLDLVEIEGLADLISAETEMQRRLALQQSGGALSGLYDEWAQRLTRIRALIEAELDFPDEEDVPGAVSNGLWPQLREIAGEMRRHLAGHRHAEIIRDGFRIVIAGRPNAGKSSLLNALAKRDVAIVTSIAGTTRDVIAVDLDIRGYLVRVMDTAGLRETDDIVEREGVRRAFKSMDDADLILMLKEVADQGAFPDVPLAKRSIAVLTKGDLIDNHIAGSGEEVAVSTKTGQGLDSLTKRILDEIELEIGSQTLLPARIRQVAQLKEALEKIEEAETFETAPLELRAELLRRAAHSLGKITGRVDVENLLDVIFSEFCIGK